MPAKGSKQKYNAKNKKTKFSKPQKYPNTRAKSIQRMDIVPTTALLKCVFDETYLMKPGATDKDNTMGLCFNLNDLISGPASTMAGTFPKSPYWGARLLDNPPVQGCINMSGKSDAAQPQGFDRYISYPNPSSSDAPYQSYTVVGGKWTFRIEQIHQTEGTGTTQDELCKLIAVATRYARTAVVDDGLRADTKLTNWQSGRDVQQVNLTALASAGTNRPSSSTNQQGRISGTWSSKKFFGYKDVKDNLLRVGGSYNEEGDIIFPEDNCFLQLGIFDRLPRGDDIGRVLPDFNIRFRYESLVLCTDVNQRLNNQA